MDMVEFYKQKEIEGLMSQVSRSRFMNEETKEFLMNVLQNGVESVMEAKTKVKEDDEDEDEEDDEEDDEEEKEMGEGKLPPALQKAIDAKKKKGNGDDDDDEEEDVEEAKFNTTANVDKALKHDCAKHVYHENLGHGVCVAGQHTLVENEDGTGTVTHYNVVFEDGMLYEDVPVTDIKVITEMSHGHKKKKK